MRVHDAVAAWPSPGESRSRKKPRDVSRRLRNSELELFARTVGDLLEGGVPILTALRGLRRAADGKKLNAALSVLVDRIEAGSSFGEALAQSGAVPPYFEQTVRAGEIGGQVPTVLTELSRYIRKEETLKNSVREAVTYPAFIVAVGIVTLGVLTGIVLPKLKSVYEGLDATLPWATKLLLGIGDLFWPGLVLLGIAGIVFIRTSGRNGILRLIRKLPWIGDAYRETVRIRFARLLSLLMSSGISILECLKAVENTFQDEAVREDLSRFGRSLATGRGFNDCAERLEWMDPVSRMLLIPGEASGRLAEALTQIARDTEVRLESRIRASLKLLEPVLIVVIGVIVGSAAIAVVLPILDMGGMF